MVNTKIRLIIFFAAKDGEASLLTVQSTKSRPGADCGSDHELLIAKFRLKLKVGKSTRPFTYNLNQIPYDCTVEMRNRFKGLDLIEYLKNYGQRFMTLYRRQGSRPSPWKRKMQKSKMAVWGGLTNSSEKKRSEKQWRKGKIKDLNAEFQRIARRDKRAFLNDQFKEIEENNKMGKTRDLFKKK